MNDACEPGSSPTRPATWGIGGRCRAATWKFLGVAVTVIGLLVGAAIPVAAAELMRVTFVRHGQSAGNASGLIDTSTPGPVLTELGRAQSQAVADTLGVNNFDGIYTSTMVRTQLTAGPMSQVLRLPIQVLPGLQEIEAGVFEGTPESEAANGYARFPLAWTFQGNRDLRIPGSINGHEFDARMDGALKTIYDSGDRNAVVFSHGGAIMFWTLMNATNLTAEQKLDLLRSYALGNTDDVVIEGNPEDGWTVVRWNGQQLSVPPTLGAEVQLQVRTLTRQLAAAAKQVFDAFATLNPVSILAAIVRGVTDATYSIAKFARAVNTSYFQELGKQAAVESATPSVESVSTPEATSTNEPTAAASTAAARTTTAPAATAAPTVDSTTDPVSRPTAAETEPSSAATKSATVEGPEAAAEPTAASNGATSVKDGNKAVPGTSFAEQRDDTAREGEKADPGTDADPSPTAGADSTDAGDDSTDAGDDGQQSDAA